MPEVSTDEDQEIEHSQPLLASNESVSQPRTTLHSSPRQSSFSKPSQNGAPRAPRTANRVRFDIEERRSRELELNGQAQPHSPETETWTEDEDYLSHDTSEDGSRSNGQRAPLLTGIEAPSVAIANELDFNPEDLLESARPKSGMRSAFMNMSNSIMYGQFSLH